MQDPRRVVFPEGEDERIIRAARIVLDEGIAQPMLLGNIDAIRRTASEVRISLEGLTLDDPADAEHRERFADYLFERRRHKGMTMADARARVTDPDLFRQPDGGRRRRRRLVAGLTQQYPDTIRPALEVIGAHPVGGLASGLYMLVFEKHVVFLRRHDGQHRRRPPSSSRRSRIRRAGCANFGIEPRVAMLSFSNFGSVKHPQAAEEWPTR